MENKMTKETKIKLAIAASITLIAIIILMKRKKKEEIIQPIESIDEKLDKKLTSLKDDINSEIKKIKLIKIKEEKIDEKTE